MKNTECSLSSAASLYWHTAAFGQDRAIAVCLLALLFLFLFPLFQFFKVGLACVCLLALLFLFLFPLFQFFKVGLACG